jgi:hypothetical protein
MNSAVAEQKRFRGQTGSSSKGLQTATNAVHMPSHGFTMTVFMLEVSFFSGDFGGAV